jgi:hypothetical protein
MKRLSKIALQLFLIAIPFLFFFALNGNRKLTDQPYRTFFSPEKRFQIEVYAYDMKKISFPGQSGDQPGIVYLRDSRSGKIVNSHEVDMVQLVENPEWTLKNVRVKLLFDWILPPK